MKGFGRLPLSKPRNVRLDCQTVERLRRLALECRLSLSDLVRQAIMEHFPKWEKIKTRCEHTE